MVVEKESQDDGFEVLVGRTRSYPLTEKVPMDAQQGLYDIIDEAMTDKGINPGPDWSQAQEKIIDLGNGLEEVDLSTARTSDLFEFAHQVEIMIEATEKNLDIDKQVLNKRSEMLEEMYRRSMEANAEYQRRVPFFNKEMREYVASRQEIYDDVNRIKQEINGKRTEIDMSVIDGLRTQMRVVSDEEVEERIQTAKDILETSISGTLKERIVVAND
jgi:Ni,Fe-hydrogenase III large subunit|tara:strand:+ start:2103 stop:2750 length:648 start_codon:yes stop_codon:yes gene_type:complete